jgi:hypothetical protein
VKAPHAAEAPPVVVRVSVAALVDYLGAYPDDSATRAEIVDELQKRGATKRTAERTL